MPGPIDYRTMIGGLLGLMQPVGDVIPFQRRNPDLKMQTEMGGRPYMGGGHVRNFPTEKNISPGLQQNRDAVLNRMATTKTKFGPDAKDLINRRLRDTAYLNSPDGQKWLSDMVWFFNQPNRRLKK